GLRAVFRIAGRDIAAVQDLDLTIGSGETVALVGESGSGKSVTSLSIIGLLPKKIGHIAEGSIALRRRDGTVTELT
ncbi:MAG: ATP-binding cassette domain-containing protein, partial [Mesorhizobium sp.]